jgi:hypothetical protein
VVVTPLAAGSPPRGTLATGLRGPFSVGGGRGPSIQRAWAGSVPGKETGGLRLSVHESTHVANLKLSVVPRLAPRPKKASRQQHASLRTEADVAALKPIKKRVEYAVRCCRGLYCAVEPTGSIRWVIRYQLDGRSRRLTLDGVSTLVEAIEAASIALAEVRCGNDPAITKRMAKSAAADAEAVRRTLAVGGAETVDHWVEQFLSRYPKQPRRKDGRPWRHSYLRMTRRIFDRFVLHKDGWSERRIDEIRREDLDRLVREIAKETPVLARRVYAAASVFFGWLCEQGVVACSPCEGTMAKSDRGGIGGVTIEPHIEPKTEQ